MHYLLGLDISTTGAKALLIDEEGNVVAKHTTPQPIYHPQPLWSEQNPDDWWRGITISIQNVVKAIPDSSDIAGIGLTGQMHGLVCLDATGHVLRPAMLWNDQRTQAECDWITATIGEQRLIQLTGNRALTGFTAPKIVWVRENEPEIYAKIAHILLPKDFIRYQLSGDYDTDLAGAAGTLLLDVEKRQWSKEVLHGLEIPIEWMPKVHEGTEVTGVVSSFAAEMTGLKVGTPIVGGAGDQAAQAVGVGAIDPGVIALTLGTSGVVFAPLSEYAYEPDGRLHAFCHALPGQYHFMGVMLSAAGSLQWYHDTLFPDVSLDDLLGEAEVISSTEGLYFLPYLDGERTPHPDPLARGAFIGLTSRHTRAHMTHAVLEGVAFGLRDSFELITASEAGQVIKEIRVSGGGAQSNLWLQILADVLNKPLIRVDAIEGGAFGAALLAGIGTLNWQKEDVLTRFVRISDKFVPNQNITHYDTLYKVYTNLYPALKDIFMMNHQ